MDKRRRQARRVRIRAAKRAFSRERVCHINNGEENLYRSNGSFMSFTKGLEHDPKTGIASSQQQLVDYRRAINAGKVKNFDAICIGSRNQQNDNTWHFYSDLSTQPEAKQIRRWESPTAGMVFDLQGPDAQAVTMPPAPPLNVGVGCIEAGDELVAEMAEVYALALLRDVPLENFDDASSGSQNSAVDNIIQMLKQLPFYKNGGNATFDRNRPAADDLTRNNVLRGQTPGEQIGPYLSQFMLLGTPHLDNFQQDAGLLPYGSINVDLRVRIADCDKDYMTHWHEWLDVQHGANVGGQQTYATGEDGSGFRLISTPRDMATYVHFDALYEAYLNACLWLLNVNAPRDTRFDNELADTKSTQGFALQGGPHILSLVTEVATRALKAVRFQKFNNHLRCRPEVLAARIAAHEHGALPDSIAALIAPMYDQLKQVGLLDCIKTHNQQQNKRTENKSHLATQHKNAISAVDNLPLLPMAFIEGSPMHPSYGAGHATVAGACVTMLKAFFDEHAVLVKNASGAHVASNMIGGVPSTEKYTPFAYVPSADGLSLNDVGAAHPLTVGDELNKLAGNVSIARNMGGVHFYTDYIESMRMGESIAIGILEEQALTYKAADEFRVGFTTFDGKACVIDQAGVHFPTAYA